MIRALVLVLFSATPAPSGHGIDLNLDPRYLAFPVKPNQKLFLKPEDRGSTLVKFFHCIFLRRVA